MDVHHPAALGEIGPTKTFNLIWMEVWEQVLAVLCTGDFWVDDV
jgi:hypothetical protein